MAFPYRPENPNNGASSTYGASGTHGSSFQVQFSGPPPPFVRFQAPPNIAAQNPVMILPPNTNFPPPYPFQAPPQPPPQSFNPTVAVQPYDGIVQHLPPTASNMPPPLSLTNNWNTQPPVMQQGATMQSFPPVNSNMPIPPASFSIPPGVNSNFPPPMPNFTQEIQPYHANDANIPADQASVENSDALWIETWSATRTLMKSSKKKTEGPTVCGSRLMLRDALQTLSDLKMATGFLKSSTNVDDEMWNFKLRKAQKLKEKLMYIMSQLSPEAVATLKRRIKRIKNKRNRLKRQRLSSEENGQLELEEREKAHATIDAWRNEIQEKVLGEKRKQELKLEADNVLSEVRKKVQEAKKSLEHLDLLERLRSARLESSEKKGLKVSSGSTEHFNQTIQRLRSIMTRQLGVYEAEEHALKVMLETEREQEAQDRKQEKMELFKACQNETLQRLFGKPPDQSSPLFIFWQFYMQGHANKDFLVEIRHQWDVYLSAQDDPGGSSVPLGWALPQPPSSNDWKAFLDSGSRETS